MYSNHRRDYSQAIGLKAEELFKNIMESRGHSVIESSKDENVYKHIDFWVNNKSVDVKSKRHLGCIWLELKNVNGYAGWLESEVEYIAFDVVELESFCIFHRISLLEFVLNNVKERANDKTEFMKFYTRANRKDVLVKVTLDNIKHLLIQQISYATTYPKSNRK